MKKSLWGVVVTVFFLAMTLYVPREAEAIPSFARQTGMACNACHFQHYPALNQFGRAFKAGGFTMVGGQSLVEGDMLSLPSALNASIVTKVRWQKTNGDNNNSGTNKGEFQFPDEAALFLGGRVGEHIGFILEAQMKDAGSSMFASYKMPIGYDVGPAHVEFVPFTTDAFGPQFSFEVLNTGAIRNIRTFEERKNISAVQFLGLQSAAQGFGFVGFHETGYINYTIWQPTNGTSEAQFLHYLRLVGTHTLYGWDLAVGGQLWQGKTVDAAKTRNVANAWAVDAQAQGMVMNFPLGVYLQYANAESTQNASETNLFNSGPNNAKAFSIVAELGVWPGRATLGLGYRDGDDGTASKSNDNAFLVAGTYQVAQNVQFQVDYSWFTGSSYEATGGGAKGTANGDQQVTLMIHAGF